MASLPFSITGLIKQPMSRVMIGEKDSRDRGASSHHSGNRQFEYSKPERIGLHDCSKYSRPTIRVPPLLTHRTVCATGYPERQQFGWNTAASVALWQVWWSVPPSRRIPGAVHLDREKRLLVGLSHRCCGWIVLPGSVRSYRPVTIRLLTRMVGVAVPARHSRSLATASMLLRICFMLPLTLISSTG